MSTYKNIPSLREHVLIEKDKDVQELERAAAEWARVSEKNKLSYEIDWLGVPVIQTPEDLVLLQELVFNIQPDFILEIGIAHGGGLIFEASLLKLLGHGTVVGVDVDIRAHNRSVIESHPLAKRIELLQGSSIADEIIQKLKQRIPAQAKVIVCLDSDHTKQHVLRELELYQDFVPPGCYIVVFDAISSQLAKAGAAKEIYIDNGPGEAVVEFLKTNDSFKIDTDFNKLYSSHNQNGYLKRVK